MRTKLAKKRHIFAKKARNCCSVSKKVNTQRKQKYYKEFRLSNIMVMYWIANLVMMVQVRPQPTILNTDFLKQAQVAPVLLKKEQRECFVKETTAGLWFPKNLVFSSFMKLKAG